MLKKYFCSRSLSNYHDSNKTSTKCVLFNVMLFLLAGTALFAISTYQPVQAQEREEPLGIAYQIKISGEIPVFNGMIVSSGETAYRESRAVYDRNMFGVVDLAPSIEFTFASTEDSYPVISDGTANVMVSGESGAIQVGDSITSSSQPGIGMKATKSGFTLGIAEESFAGQTATDTGLVSIRLNKQFTFAEDAPDSETISDRLKNIVSLSAIAAFEEPTKVLRYLVAGLVLSFSVLLSFITLSRTSQRGIEAIGRNPLAKNSILISVFVNIVISLVILVTGVAGAYIVVTL